MEPIEHHQLENTTGGYPPPACYRPAYPPGYPPGYAPGYYAAPRPYYPAPAWGGWSSARWWGGPPPAARRAWWW